MPGDAQNMDFAFRVSNFRFRVSGFGFRASGSIFSNFWPEKSSVGRESLRGATFQQHKLSENYPLHRRCSHLHQHIERLGGASLGPLHRRVFDGSAHPDAGKVCRRYFQK